MPKVSYHEHSDVPEQVSAAGKPAKRQASLQRRKLKRCKEVKRRRHPRREAEQDSLRSPKLKVDAHFLETPLIQKQHFVPRSSKKPT